MKGNLQAERRLLNRNVDELNRLLQCATGNGIWTPQEGTRHVGHHELVRAKLNADFRELMDLRERVKESWRSAQSADSVSKK
jgi:hypothetical protein